MSTQASETEERIEQKTIIADAEPTVIKRAQWEAFEFAIESPGRVRVINESYTDPTAHTLLVDVEDGVPVGCECPAFKYGDGPCKHIVAVAIRKPILAATADAQTPTIPDGGEPIETCRNGQEDCCGSDGDDLPCWECYRAGRLGTE